MPKIKEYCCNCQSWNGDLTVDWEVNSEGIPVAERRCTHPSRKGHKKKSNRPACKFFTNRELKAVNVVMNGKV